MKKVVITIVVLMCSQAFGLSFMGPATTELNQGQSNFGFDYTFSEMDLELSWLGVSWTEEIETNMLFGKYSYGITDDWEGYFLLGFANVEADDFDSSAEFAYGFGTKVNLGNYNGMDWGALFQISWFEGDDTFSGFVPGIGFITADQEIKAYEIQIAVGPTYEANGLKIYGGPFFHFVDGDYDVDIAGISIGTIDIEEESIFGGYIGISKDLTENTNIGVEFQYTGDAQAVGVRYVFRF